MRILMTTLITAVAAASLLSSPLSQAKSSVSSKFDGSYRAQVSAIGALSAADCVAPAFVGATITKGMLAANATDKATMNGIVTEEGFVTGRVSYANGKSAAIEGRIINGTFLGGMLSDEGRCAWLIKLTA